ncbi:hypothetical protein AAFN88_21365 [Pelagibius sp. CAU 1746]|uniref:hypothetical protein n=1 Tax=Pelagibius sp. CAU 1746 TaxID=3140370 RepID=UPI00325A6C90
MTDSPAENQASPVALWRAGAGLALVLGLLAGLRLPSIWSATHALFDYHEGFIKRGLFGEFLSLVFGHQLSYWTFALVSYLIFILWLSLLLRRLRTLGETDPWIWIAGAVFFLSPGFVFLVHEIGYFDHLGLLCLLVCFLLPADLRGCLARIVLCTAMVLTHEAFFLMFFPVLLFQFYLRATLRQEPRALLLTVVLALAVAAVTYLVGQAALPPGGEAAMAAYLQERAADFRIRSDAVGILFRDGGDNLRNQFRIWIRVQDRALYAAVGVLVLLPLPVLFLRLATGMLRRAPGRRRLMAFGAAAAAAAPLSLNVVASDMWRFFALAQITAFLVFLAVRAETGAPVVQPGRAARTGYLLATVAVLGALSGLPLFDGHVPARPPFVETIGEISRALRAGEPLLLMPTR